MVFRTIGIYVITSPFFLRFLTFFQNPIQKVVTFYVFLPCFVRFLELCSLIRKVRILFEVGIHWLSGRQETVVS